MSTGKNVVVMENKSDSNVSNGTPGPATAPATAPAPEANGAAGAGDGGAAKPVNPLRLARPLEKTGAGLVKTSVPASRPLPMPTISPLCPPGQKNGVKAPSPAAPAPAETEKPSEEKKDNQEDPSGNEATVSADPKVDTKETKTDDPNPETKSEPNPVSVETTAVKEIEEKPSKEEQAVEIKDADSSSKKDNKEDKTVTENGKVDEKEEVKKQGGREEKEKDVKKNEDDVTPPTEAPPKKPENPKNGTQQLATSPTVKKKAEGHKIPVAEKTPRQTTKRKKSVETDLQPERTSKRSRAPPDVFKASDPEMDHILKTIKKQEDEAAKKGPDKTTAEPEKKTERAKKQPAVQPASKAPAKTSSRKKRKASESEESEIDFEEESEEEDFKPVKAKAKKTPPKKPIRKSKMNNAEPASKKNAKKEPVFFK